MKLKLLFISSLVFAGLFLASCNTGNSESEAAPPDTPVAKATPIGPESTCNLTLPLPASCTDCATCSIEISKQHWIPYQKFIEAIAGYCHKPHSMINMVNIFNTIGPDNCNTHKIAFTADFAQKLSNEDIKIKKIRKNERDGNVFYEISLFKGLQALGATDIRVYKGLTMKSSSNCPDILLEVTFSDSLAYYDLSDSEGDE